ncbi:DNA polymerase III subunit gamma/tau [Thalassoroseus pseudoceratinae]|uniref:DNA polymerase III subunit gamma/tau n=1 Tax=Thalassoroseus pseudoceratinae TaxID=2713176 RepID=UPI00142218D7|nr:DNA polymerase III subunit gamma/tau [Thalassoroseus pseudoceratinae]
MDTNSPHYTVLARRFRPQTFDEVIGQQHVARALQNAIRHERVAHAYLFTGARGVGKTSMARILAKALNCPNVNDAVPCNNCDICQAISVGNDVDVLEIDGASNRGIDDIRQLRANVNVKSMRSRYKVYIIDEVHMLTTDAFNALLKTLEEPPPGVKFVFCTTEPEKLLDTILSRCQRFDFASIETQNIVERLAEIATAEGYEVAPEALELVARRAGGSMRDSQSLFDQVLAFAEDTITADDIHQLLGTATDDRLVALVDALVSRDRPSLVQLFDAALASGVQLTELTDQLLRYLRDLMLTATGAETTSLMSVSENHRDTLRRQAEDWGLPTIIAALQILTEARSQMNRVNYGRVLGELALIRISLLEDLRSIDAMLHAIQTKDERTDSIPSPRRIKSQDTAERPASANSAPTPPPVTEKKKLETEQKPEIPHQTAPPSRPKVKIKKGCEPELLTQLIETSDVRFQSHLRTASLAIFEPNGLELAFDTSYDFSRRFCEKNLDEIQRLACRLTGQSVAVRIAAPAESTSPQPKAPVAESRPRRSMEDVENIPFVRDLLSVFNAKVLQVQTLKAAEVASIPDLNSGAAAEVSGLSEPDGEESQDLPE